MTSLANLILLIMSYSLFFVGYSRQSRNYNLEEYFQLIIITRNELISVQCFPLMTDDASVGLHFLLSRDKWVIHKKLSLQSVYKHYVKQWHLTPGC
jgi:hypothetical protein